MLAYKHRKRLVFESTQLNFNSARLDFSSARLFRATSHKEAHASPAFLAEAASSYKIICLPP